MTISAEQASVGVLRATLLDIPDVVDLVQWENGAKIFWEHVPDIVPNPYIVIKHYYGGKEKDPRYTDDVWLIFGHTADMETASKFSGAIAALDNAKANTDGFPNVCSYFRVYKTAPYFYRYQVQDRVFFRAGGLFRLRLYLGENYG